MFVDASALTSIVVGEKDADDLTERLQDFTPRITSPVALWETTLAVARIKQVPLDLGRREVERFLVTLGIGVEPIDLTVADEAIRAHALYGKGTGHKAGLNMGDCFAYACARTNHARLLYKGDDFLHTDLGR
ncbi:type II toxin-antitoxin system VapC family toxin [Sphingomonas sp. KR1UV-12]|uniref:Ribonuclease VapC n=1 Tax=Sphingomonas aurea TaxID=3063994 RepID=A0ABT9EMP9_9SPHN|nr:type II toxin-antitoxin system VapC family toxin [Sphingomonas sp. KR1UV-12]MDP1028245.1 type II toxin-antitoxin system VapC family toxin [Sphingomonas sp. KR1UV-12]